MSFVSANKACFAPILFSISSKMANFAQNDKL